MYSHKPPAGGAPSPYHLIVSPDPGPQCSPAPAQRNTGHNTHMCYRGTSDPLTTHKHIFFKNVDNSLTTWTQRLVQMLQNSPDKTNQTRKQSLPS